MSYPDILVQVDDGPTSQPRVAGAAALAARWGAGLTGVFLKSEFLLNYMAADSLSYLTPADIDMVLKDHADGVAAAGAKAREVFEQAAREAGVTTDWRLIGGDQPDELIACARRFDLTVFPTAAVASFSQTKTTAAQLALASGGPVLVVPDGGFGPTIGKRVLVAWKGSRESARALRDAWPVIAGAESAHVLIVPPHGETGADPRLLQHFERHGCKAEIHVEAGDDAAAGDILREQIEALEIDLVVMGLYGRTRLQELVLGGVSREMLREPPVPLLVSH